MQSPLQFVDLIKLSLEECPLLTENTDPEKAITFLLEKNIPVVVVTLGEEGAMVGTREGIRKVGGFQPETVVDTTGAGDAFWGAFLTGIVKKKKAINGFSLSELEAITSFANAAASLSVEKRGAIPSMPKMSDIVKREGKNGA